ncbi:xylose isomerase [Halobacteriales archaeon SW_7_68_16]|nr:MAG: xylose isomerase [Halobacteriales archaeon SW_7_68_16]
MHVGVLTVPFGDLPRDEAFEYLAGLGVDAVELGCGGHPGQDHCDRERLLNDGDARATLRADLERHDLTVSALATHNNPLHPVRGDEDAAELRGAIDLAAELDVGTVTCFSGLPAGRPGDETPNWITAPWPDEHAEALRYQWEEVAIPIWTELAAYAAERDVAVAIEPHPNMLVHEPTGLLRLRAATGDAVGANFDPSHLYWQGIDVPTAIRELGDAIHHVHAKDTGIDERAVDRKGVLDTTSYREPAERSWQFRTVGYGHGEAHWREIVSALRLAGYDGALSIEHEDALTSVREGVERAVDTLSNAVFETRPDEVFWA